MALYQLPMNECSSCGQIVGHMYDDFYTLTKQLTTELKTRSIPSETYRTTEGKDITEFIRVYYSWFDKNKGKVLEYFPANIIARALLATVPLEESLLPFGHSREPDGQISFNEPKICCLRMLETDPMMTDI